jgi:hypothetical protein
MLIVSSGGSGGSRGGFTLTPHGMPSYGLILPASGLAGVSQIGSESLTDERA